MIIKKYKYTDNRTNPPTLVLEIEAVDILDADARLKVEKGIDIIKTPYIGCSVEMTTVA
jgi:hypothetical protein